MNASITLEQRIANLEAISEIKGLKYRYWQACDQKDPHSMIECFASEESLLTMKTLAALSQLI